MPVINTTSAFPLVLDDGRTVNVPAGESDQPDEVADHWFTKAHLVETPRGRMPVVEGPDGLMIEADEAGQRVHEGASLSMTQVGSEAFRQEGPVDWGTRNPNAVEAAKARAEDANAPVEGTRVETQRRTRVAAATAQREPDQAQQG